MKFILLVFYLLRNNKSIKIEIKIYNYYKINKGNNIRIESYKNNFKINDNSFIRHLYNNHLVYLAA